MPPSDLDGQPRIERFLRDTRAAEQLVVSAVSAVESFYNDKPPSLKLFIRDTLDDPVTNTFSTGGAGVVADLWEIQEPLRYLSVAIGDRPFARLDQQKREATEWLASSANPLTFSGTFGSANPFTLSVVAQQVVQAASKSDRGIVFGAAVLDTYRQGWPVLAGVEDAHPYVACRLFRAAEATIRAGVMREIATCNARATVEAARVPEGAAFEGHITALQGDPLDIRTARVRYLDLAKAYLWRQNGFAVPGSSSAPNSLSYDPVGTCFALDILFGAAAALSAGTDAKQHLAEYEDIIHLSVRHILAGMAPTGSLAYGLPFSYDEKGMGAFATSISGLAALARVLSQIFEASRRSFYSNASFIEELLASNTELVERLFALPTNIEGAKRRVEHLGRPRSGWSTDRAASFRRIESWVSADVLQFAVHLRLLAQEVAQFYVVRKYGAAPVLHEPRWPYVRGEDPVAPLKGPDVMQDPDERETPSEIDEQWGRLSPVPFLHEGLRSFMMPSATEWRSESCSFLLFGPPGTAKSTLARSLAQCLQWHFLELTPSNFVEAGLEMIEQRSREIFAELGVLRETVVLFDELDSLLTDREQLDRSSILNFTVPAMLPKLQALTKLAKKQRLVLIFATNFYDRLDPAMARRGRIDERLLVLPPNATARRRMLARTLQDEALDRGIDETALAVYEDLRRYADDVQSGKAPTPPYAGITPALYFSRLPARERRMSSLRSTQRLAIEVAEVIGRLLNQSRALNADAGHGQIVSRLEELKAKMSGSDWPEWLRLCDGLIAALSASS